MKAAIIAIGNELLNGISSDTNSVFIREKLIGIGIPTESIQVVGDKKGSIINALDSVAADIDVVLCTGGLGPTHDDITMRVTADYFDSQIGPSTEVREQIETLFRKRGVPVNRISVRNQSLVPEKAVLIPNLNGTAPGLKFSKYGKRYYFMPGVPVEMKNMFMQSILPELRKESNRNIYIRTVHTTGVPESVLFGNIEQWISRHSDIRVSILPRFPEVDISLLCHNGDKSILNDAIRELSQILKDNIYGFDDDTLESVIAERLINHKITVATAESCTGGFIANRLTNISGSSGYFMQGVVTYSNQSKIERLQISPDTLDKYGAVSAETAIEMARNISQLAGTDIGLSTTGIAGPTGGTIQKPVGTVFIGISVKGQEYIYRHLYNRDRLSNKLYFSQMALNHLRLLLKEHYG